MPAKLTGSVTHRQTKRGLVYGLRFTAGGKRRHTTLPDGTTREEAERELRGKLSEVERGIWQPPKPAPVVAVEEDPLFWDFAETWFEATKAEWREATRLDYQWQLEHHLLPFFKAHRLSQITIAEVDRYRQHKVAEHKLGATSINKTITRLGQVLEVAVERELLPRNTAKVGGKRRKVKSVAPRRVYMDRAEQIGALLAAAEQLDAKAKSNGRIHRRAVLATLVFAGLRIGELIALDWSDVDLQARRLRVRQSKTDAGIRHVDLLPVLHAELSALKAARDPRVTDRVFPTQQGGPMNASNVRTRVLANAVKHANQSLAEAGLTALPEGLSPHALRRTFASVLVALGKDPVYVMGQMGHTDPTVTLGLYAKVMQVSDEDRERLGDLVEGRPARSQIEAAA